MSDANGTNGAVDDAMAGDNTQALDGVSVSDTSIRNSVSALSGSNPALPLSGKVALITGGGRGIGAGIALTLASKGASVAINYSSSSTGASSVVTQISSTGGTAHAFQADITSPSAIDALFTSVLSHFSRLDIVVSNSGRELFTPLPSTTPEDFDSVFALNTRAQFFVGKAAQRHLEPRGRLVLMSSIAAGLGVPGHALYAGSKAAVESFTRCFAWDLGGRKCTANCIAPAGVKTDMWDENSWRYAPGCGKGSSRKEIEKALAGGSPLGRCAVPEDVGRVVAFLCSEEGEWVNGQIIHVDGGARV
ncbi:MAG: Arp2/3 complex subunit, actin nucleation center [Stictis urceolatum]|nr:Arp2/3 complex subunit, actin nucleation center [Stictis urceolata]